MKVLVLGNVGAGKTTVVRRLAKIYSWEVVSVDDFRREFGDGSLEAELEARQRFLEKIKPQIDQFIECTGVGKVSDAVLSLLNQTDERAVCVILDVPKEVCDKRLENRVWDVPFMAPREKLDVFMEKISRKIETGAMEEEWSNRNNTRVLKRTNLTEDDTKTIINELKDILDEPRMA